MSISYALSAYCCPIVLRELSAVVARFLSHRSGLIVTEYRDSQVALHGADQDGPTDRCITPFEVVLAIDEDGKCTRSVLGCGVPGTAPPKHAPQTCNRGGYMTSREPAAWGSGLALPFCCPSDQPTSRARRRRASASIGAPSAGAAQRWPLVPSIHTEWPPCQSMGLVSSHAQASVRWKSSPLG